MEPTKIYIVFGQSGEYSDAEEWMVKAFREKNQANTLAKNAQKEAERLLNRTDYDDAIEYLESLNLNKYDKNCRTVYYGVNYVVREIELL